MKRGRLFPPVHLQQAGFPDRPGSEVPFEIEITPDGPLTGSGMSPETLRQTFPFH